LRRDFFEAMPARRAFFLLLPLIAVFPAAMHPEDTPVRKPLSPAAKQWVESTFSRLTTDEKIGQIVFPTYFGGFESTESVEFKELMSRVKQNHIGGFILATRRGPRGIELSHVYETAVLTNELQKAAAIPLLIGADFERGTVMRVEEGTAFPHAMAVGATGRPEDAYAMGRITAIEARAMGVHWAFAPVADVNSNPDNPIINIRSFGEDPKRVAEYVAQFVRGVEENGAMATAKHFPGHGDTAEDSHLELPLVKADRARLEAVEFVPFEAAIGAGVSSIMTAHLAVPALEPDPDAPATLSERVLTGVLRGEMQFHGLVITDALDMGGVTKGFPPGEVAVRALLAGADVLLMSPVTDAALASVRDAVASGRVPMVRLDDAVRRVLQAKARLGLDQKREVGVEKLSGTFRRPEFLATAQDIADRGVTLLRNDAGLVPLDPRTTKRVFLLAMSADPDTIPAEPFERELRAQLDTVESLHVDTKYFRVENTHLPSPDSYDLGICALTVRVADHKNTVGLPADEAEMVHALLRAGKPVIMVGLGSPYIEQGFPEATTWLAAFSVQDVAERAAARAVLGQFAVSGKLPVSLPGAAPVALHVGDGMTTTAIPLKLRSASAELDARLKPARAILETALDKGEIRWGTFVVDYDQQMEALEVGQSPEFLRDIWERPFAPTLSALLIAEKQLTLDTPIYRVLPEWISNGDVERRKRVTVRQLLENTSGISAEEDAAVLQLTEKHAIERAVSVPLVAEPGSAVCPSGVNALLFLEIAKRLTGMDTIDALRERMQFMFSAYPPGTRWRPALLGDARAQLAQLWLNGGIYEHHRYFSRSVAEQLTARREVAGVACTAGWDVPSPGSETEKYLSDRAYGSAQENASTLWIDPPNKLFVDVAVRTADRNADTERKLRAEVYKAIFAAIGLERRP
jgi:beta-N-acetylhexosaminidase